VSGRCHPYSDPELGVRFEIDDSFAPEPGREPPAGIPDEVKSAYLVAPGPEDGQAVLSISRVSAGSETSPHELADHLLIHNRYAAHTAEQNGWTIHSPWKATLLAGYPAMHCDYVVPGSAVVSGLPDAVGAAPSAPAGHVQEWIAYAGRQTFQLMLGVDPPGDLARNRAIMDTIVRTFEIGEPPVSSPGGENAPRTGEPPADSSGGEDASRAHPAPVEPD
jgi:hypothetical protein